MKKTEGRAFQAWLRLSSIAAVTLCVGSLCVAQSVYAANPLGLYLGAAYGEAHVRAESVTVPAGVGHTVRLGGPDFTHSAYQIMLGVRPLSWIGAEVTYMDLGRHSWPSAQAGVLFKGGQVSQKGEGAFVVLYLPVPLVTFYLKGGVSRLTTDRSVDYEYVGVDQCAFSTCHYLSTALHGTTTGFAAGAGVQWAYGQWTLRAEYERFNAAGASPNLISVGVLWSLP